MPEIPINSWYHDDLYPPDDSSAVMDEFTGMFPVPEKMQEQIEQEEKTPEQLRLEHFHDQALTYRENYAGPAGGRYSIAMDDVCRFEGWPRRHTVVGRNCPHGMLETLEMMKEEET